jgi:hypothetical protein
MHDAMCEMTPRHPLSQRLHALLIEIGQLHDKKQKDYGVDNDPFANVRGSAEWGVQPWVGAMVRANDKMKRLQKFAKVGSLANEAVEDSFKDLAVYSLIGLVLYEESCAGQVIPVARETDGFSKTFKQAAKDLLTINSQR